MLLRATRTSSAGVAVTSSMKAAAMAKAVSVPKSRRFAIDENKKTEKPRVRTIDVNRSARPVVCRV